MKGERYLEGILMRELDSLFIKTNEAEFGTLEEKIFTYGEELSEDDYLGRNLFVCMVTFWRMAKEIRK